MIYPWHIILILIGALTDAFTNFFRANSLGKHPFRLHVMMAKDRDKYEDEIEYKAVTKPTPYIGEEMSEWDGYMVKFR